MAEAILNVQTREQTGKQYAKKLRQTGKIPGIYYTHGEDSVSIIVNERELKNIISSETSVIDLNFGDKKRTKCVLREVQFDPVRGNPLHVDLMGIKLTEKVTVEVPIHLVGTPVGVKTSEGILQHILREVELECLPLDIPEHIEVDVSHLDIGDSIHVGEISIEKVEILTEADRSIAIVSPPTVVREVVEEAPAEEAEPEVVGKEEETPE